jgi:hypothetical protein
MISRGSIRLPDYVVDTVERHPVMIEICYAITHAIWTVRSSTRPTWRSSSVTIWNGSLRLVGHA